MQFCKMQWVTMLLRFLRQSPWKFLCIDEEQLESWQKKCCRSRTCTIETFYRLGTVLKFDIRVRCILIKETQIRRVSPHACQQQDSLTRLEPSASVLHIKVDKF